MVAYQYSRVRRAISTAIRCRSYTWTALSTYQRHVACRIGSYNGKAHLKANVQKCSKRNGCGSASELKLVVNYKRAMQSIVPI